MSSSATSLARLESRLIDSWWWSTCSTMAIARYAGHAGNHDNHNRDDTYVCTQSKGSTHTKNCWPVGDSMISWLSLAQGTFQLVTRAEHSCWQLPVYLLLTSHFIQFTRSSGLLPGLRVYLPGLLLVDVFWGTTARYCHLPGLIVWISWQSPIRLLTWHITYYTFKHVTGYCEAFVVAERKAARSGPHKGW